MAATSKFLVVLSAGMCLSDAGSILTEQRQALNKLKCEPKETWVYIESQLEPQDDLPDKTYYPHMVSVLRCLKECSFGSNPRWVCRTRLANRTPPGRGLSLCNSSMTLNTRGRSRSWNTSRASVCKH
ncbi:hypothetical protein GWK47_024153 [Chionoecetes opilio]|uniref:Uncharacterized protein n=1 Tax=Chionoecetes opilio TaxID=41210 RepID=A0A8J4XPZ8_CHIOP|nr:hypothetical protein GWK47_024153 [Chionoecetes opilio]